MTFSIDDYTKGLTDFLEGTRLVMPQSIPAYVATHGRVYTKRVKLPKKQIRPKSRECYYNAWQLWRRRRDELHYAEGYIALEGCPIPVMHGWCVDLKGRVVDPSVANELGCVYCGVKFTPDYTDQVWLVLRLSGYIGIFENAYLLDEELDFTKGVLP